MSTQQWNQGRSAIISTPSEISIPMQMHTQDIQTAVAFLCTRVQSPDEDDLEKLQRSCRTYAVCNLTLTIKLGEHTSLWVDNSYVVHPDMKSHSRIFMILVKIATIIASSKQKLNTKSSIGSCWWHYGSSTDKAFFMEACFRKLSVGAKTA